MVNIIRTEMNIFMPQLGETGDHRCVDGALGAQLLGAFKTLIENPVLILV